MDSTEATIHTNDYFREKILSFAQLSKGWDSYSADAPSDIAVSAALTLLDELEKANLVPEWVAPTGDSSILMQYKSGEVWFNWEFDSDGDVAVMRKLSSDKEIYHDLSADEIASFFAAQSE
jgi:hypothetical protein